MFNYKFNQGEARKKWGETISTVTGLTSEVNESKLQTIANMCQISENLEVQRGAIRGGYDMSVVESYGPSDVPNLGPGMGAVQFPADPTGDISQTLAPNYKRGSDFAAAKLGLMMHTAAHTIALDLVPVIPIDMPNVMYGFLDTIYTGGRLNSVAEKPRYIELYGGDISTTAIDYTTLVEGQDVFLTLSNAAGDLVPGVAIQGKYIGTSRINSRPIMLVQNTGNIDAAGAFTVTNTASVADVTGAAAFHALVPGASDVAATVADRVAIQGPATAELVSALDNHIQGAATISGFGEDADVREEAELGHQGKIGARFYTKSVAPKDISIEGEATRHQVRDLGAYGIDVYAHLFKAAQNELTQFINKDILRTLFRLGVTNANKLKISQGVDLNLFLANGATPNKDLANFRFLNSRTGEFRDITGADVSASFTAVENNETNSSAENKHTRDFRIQSKLQAASSLIGNVSRRGIGDFAVVNEQIKSALRTSAANPITLDNTIASSSTASLYYVGKLGDLQIYCDPNMAWEDTRVLVGRKGAADDSGLKFMPYDLVSSVDTIAEQTMSFKFVVSSSYALLPAGFYPEINYMTLALDTDFASFV